MKNLKTIALLGCTAILVSCGTTKETTSSKEAQNRGRDNQEVFATKPAIPVDKSRTIRQGNTGITSPAEKPAASEEQRKMQLKNMFDEVGMTGEQVQRFENNWQNVAESWKRNNGDKEMNNYERIEYQDRILRDILDDNQFRNYQDWMRENADKK